MTVGGATMKYTHTDDKDKPRGDKFCPKPFCHPKLKIQCPGCKLWGHNNTTCDFLARTLFDIDYIKTSPDKAKKIAGPFYCKNTKEAKAFIKTLHEFPAGPTPPLPDTHRPPNNKYEDGDAKDEDYFIEDYLGTMISGFALSIKTAAAVPVNTLDHMRELLQAIDPMALQKLYLPPFPQIEPPRLCSWQMTCITRTPSQ
jgi:hypothetical protein